MSGSYLLRPNTVWKSVRPLVPANVFSWPTMISVKISAIAWLSTAKYGPRTRRENTSQPNAPAISIGMNSASTTLTQRFSNGFQMSGSSVWSPYSAMKLGSSPGPTCSSERCMPIA